jgi:hypothetical protein
MDAVQVIEANAQAMRRAGIPEFVIQTLQKESLAYSGTLKLVP